MLLEAIFLLVFHEIGFMRDTQIKEDGNERFKVFFF